MVDEYVVLADVVESRTIEDRTAFRDRLDGALSTVNERHEDTLVAPFATIKGIDEFGAVVTDLGPLYEMLHELLARIHPVRIRVAIASGEIDVREGSVRTMDGPAFHRADALFERIEAEAVAVGVDTGNAVDDLLASVLELLLLSWERRTERQVEVLRAVERHPTQAAAADALGLTPQSVSNTLRRIEYRRMATIRERLASSVGALYG